MASGNIKERNGVMEVQDRNEGCAGHQQAQQAKRKVSRFGELPPAVKDTPGSDTQTVKPIDPVAWCARIPKVHKHAEPRRSQGIDQRAKCEHFHFRHYSIEYSP